jgi:hypothetical protein
MIKTFVIVLFLMMSLACSDRPYESNKKVNFDLCNKQCADAGTTLKQFEQGLGYVKCECQK